MMEENQERFEAGLQQIQPAKVPADLMTRLRGAARQAGPVRGQPRRWNFAWAGWFSGWRGLALAAPTSALILFICAALHPAAEPKQTMTSAIKKDKPNAVQVDRSLVASFDTVARLPDGEPVRFRCREWRDDVVIRDASQGVVISQSTPRVEVVPVRFEIY